MGAARLHPSSPLASLALSARKSAIALIVGASGTLVVIATAPPDVRLVGAVLAYALAWASVVDIDRFVLPDLLTLGLVVLGLGLSLADGIDAARPHILGVLLGYGSLASLAWVYRRMRGHNGLGMGDAKLLAAAGAWLSWAALPFVILIAALSCLVVVGTTALMRRRSGEKRSMMSAYIPFGPYLAASFFILWLVQVSGRV